MATTKAKTVAEYLASLPEDRRKTVEAVRKVILKHLPKPERTAARNSPRRRWARPNTIP